MYVCTYRTDMRWVCIHVDFDPDIKEVMMMMHDYVIGLTFIARHWQGR